MVIPPFDARGLLPPGDYNVTFKELKSSVLVMGTGLQGWDSIWRLHLVAGLEILVNQLWQIGLDTIYVNGSFVENVAHPNDIDGYFHCDGSLIASGELQQKLNALDPYKVWTWDHNSRRSFRGSRRKQLPMWHRYRVELYPHYGQWSGIFDKDGNELRFPSAFRQERFTGEKKGIVRLLKGDL